MTGRIGGEKRSKGGLSKFEGGLKWKKSEARRASLTSTLSRESAAAAKKKSRKRRALVLKIN
jgi:hypothetical protein